MKIQIEKDKLVKVVQAAQGIVPVKSALPILSNILMETEDGKLKLTATDLEVGIICTVDAEIHESGAITVPAKKFSEMTRELPQTNILLTTLKNNTVSIMGESVYFKLFGLPKDEFPKVPQLKEEEAVELSGQTLKRMFEMTAFAASKDEARHILNGILLVVENNKLKIVATDGRRLALIERDIDGPQGLNKKIIIPAKAIYELNKVIQEDAQAKIIFGENQAMFKTRDAQIITRLIEGDFPNYQHVLPQQAQNKIKVNTQKFLFGAKRAGLLTNQDSQSIRIDVLKNKMVLSKSTPQLGEAKDHIDIQYGGKEMSIGFNSQYLLDALKNIDLEEIDFELTGPDKAGVIRTQDNYTYLILPMELG